MGRSASYFERVFEVLVCDVVRRQSLAALLQERGLFVPLQSISSETHLKIVCRERKLSAMRT